MIDWLLSMAGQILMNLLFAAALVSSLAYFISLRGNDALQKIGRIFLRVVFGGMVVASIALLINIVNHRFEFSYVSNYSSRELPLHLLISTFYAGQEGSFMLWTLFVSTIGMILLPYVRRRHYESETMGFFALILVFLLLMLIAKNPFTYIWETFPGQIAEGFIPENGRGLNPLLHNSWIIIHPPILFSGFAVMTVPFAFAMAALVKRDYHNWIGISLPWTLFATAVLGFGIMLGGFWAYETLGWGGFWGWDPVENSSLIPWLVGVALVHTMLTQKKTKGLVKTNLALAVIAFILILYSTFLTRSGVLGDTSVHSFVDPGFFAYVLLIVFMATFVTIGFGAILMRAKDIAASQADFHPTSREFALSIGSSVVLASAVIVLIGTSWPIITELSGDTKVAIEIEFYNRMHLPLAILIVIINALAHIMSWRSTAPSNIMRRLQWPIAVSAIATVAAFIVGVRDVWYMVLTFGSFLALFVNAELAIRLIRNKPGLIGAYVSHFGIALLFLGIIATSKYSVTEHVRLPQGEAVESLGYSLTFLGKEQIERHYKDRDKYHYHIAIGGDTLEQAFVAPVLYWSDFNKRASAFLEPGIFRTPFTDLYISPKAVESDGGGPRLTLMKNQSAPLPFDPRYTVTVLRFDMSAALNSQDPSSLKLGVVVEVAGPQGKQELTLFTTFYGSDQERTNAEPVAIAGVPYFLEMERIIPNRENLALSQAALMAVDTSDPTTVPRDIFIVEVSVKPFINLVWIGVILMALGFFISIVRRLKEYRIEPIVNIRRSEPAGQSGSVTNSVPAQPSSLNGSSDRKSTSTT